MIMLRRTKNFQRKRISTAANGLTGNFILGSLDFIFVVTKSPLNQIIDLFCRSQKRGKTQTKDEQLYGSFADNDGNSSDEEFSKKRNRKRKTNSTSNFTQKEVGFVAASSKKDNVPVKIEKPDTGGDDADSILEENFENILKATIPVPGDSGQSSGLSNEQFSKIITENETSGKKPNLPASSLKDIGTWEKHTKGDRRYNVPFSRYNVPFSN